MKGSVATIALHLKYSCFFGRKRMNVNAIKGKKQNVEPSALERASTKLAFLLFGKSVYKDFAARLPLAGDEYVLDFGCGMGTVAYYVAKRLPRGKLVCADISQRWLSSCKKTLRRYDNIALEILNADSILLPNGFDVVYCHFVLHDILKHELAHTISMLVDSLKPGGKLVFREPLDETEILGIIKRLVEQKGLSLIDSRVTDVPYMGNALESTYIKFNGGFLCYK